MPIRTPPPAALPLFESNQVRYTPEAGFVGEDGFTYVVADGNGGTDEGAVTVSVVNRSVPTPGTCGTGFAQGDLNTSNVFARDVQHRLHRPTATGPDSEVRVPLGSETSPLFAAGLWVGGTVGGQVRAAGARYNNFTFWPGPLNEDGTLPEPNRLLRLRPDLRRLPPSPP